jgi:DNA-binding transcriptional LysR family regulator
LIAMLDTDQLRSFLAIVDTGSFTKAGERVHKTQSAVSMHIRRLEEQLGCALFVKQGRSARLTEEGQRLIDYARRMIQVEAGAMPALSRKGLRGSVRLGIPDDYAEAFLADILTIFNRRQPLVAVSAVCENSVELTAQVHAGALELALITDHEDLQGFELVREEPLVWVAAPRFKPPEGAPVPLAVGSPNCIWGKVTEAALREWPVATHSLFSSRNYTAVIAVVRAGLAATALPLSMVGDELCVLSDDVGMPSLPPTRMGLIFAPGRASAEAKALAESIRGAIADHARKAA